MTKSLSEYNRKRNFDVTSEPQHQELTKKSKGAHALHFVIQKHDARRLHYDFRLELDGTLKSWAVPKGPSLDPKDKRLAVHVEDHPISYANFEGSIPEGQYGAGEVIVWDRGVWQPHGDPEETYKAGKLKFTLIGEKLTGDWALVRTRLTGSGEKEQWLLIKERDQVARSAEEYDITTEQPQSVITGAVINTEKVNSKKKVPEAKKQLAVKNESAAKKSSIVKKESAFKKDSAVKILPEEKLTAPKAKKKLTDSIPLAAKQAEIPESFSPELATLVSEAPEGDWLYEIKFDGYRILARILDGEVTLFTRNQNDWTARLPLQAKAIAALNLKDAWLDGEIVVLDDDGLPSFQALQQAFEIGKSHNIIYYLFDAPYLHGCDMRGVPVEERRAELKKVLSGSKKELLRFSEAFAVSSENILASACAMSLEGVIGKRVGSTYVSRRSGDWIKLKCRLRQEFVIVGYTQPQGNRSGFGALLLAVHDQAGQSALRYAGRVGTGFNEISLHHLYEQLKKLQRNKSPVTHNLQSASLRGVSWVEPTLVCEVEFAAWTSDGVLRQAAFIALRSDKPARDIIREQAISPEDLTSASPVEEKMSVTQRKPKTNESEPTKEKIKATTKATATETKSQTVKSSAKKTTQPKEGWESKIAITHPDRIIDPDTGATKKDLAIYYAEISDWMLPHLKQRPVSILRAPEGIGGEQFFQKHTEHLDIPNIKHLDPALDPGHAALMEIDNRLALVGAVQMGTIELHTWGSKSDKIEMPDRITLDLDPDPALPWRSMIEATQLTLSVLDELKLDAFLKTSGGKGLHIIIPLAPRADWEYVKEFSKAISQFMANEIPERFVAKMGPKNRIGKIFVDYLRNQRGASTIAAYSARARAGLPVSVPIARDELLTLTASSQWNIGNLHERLDGLKTDPWQGYKNRQRITSAMWKQLDAEAPRKD
ncbi:MAG: DNA ligase D [Pseudomonadota bacterium]